MPDAAFSQRRTTTHTQRPTSTALRPDPLALKVAICPPLRRSVAPSLPPTMPTTCHYDKKNDKTNPFQSPTSTPKRATNRTQPIVSARQGWHGLRHRFQPPAACQSNGQFDNGVV